MRFEELLNLAGGQPVFDLATLVQLSAPNRPGLRVQLSRWIHAGRLLPLRRGMYALADQYRRAPVNPAALANLLYRPSYLSARWALGFYGMIPERVSTLTSVTTRVPRTFNNAFGEFEYRHVKRPVFSGYAPVMLDGQKVLLADPEKALLDLWHLERGDWTAERMVEMRFQSCELVKITRLKRYAVLFDSPRLLRAVATWRQLAASDEEGTVEI